MEIKNQDKIIILKNNNNKIYLIKNKKYSIEEFKVLFKSENNITYEDFEDDEIEITEEEEIKYFIKNWNYITNKIIINQQEFKILKKSKNKKKESKELNLQLIVEKKKFQKKVKTCLDHKEMKKKNVIIMNSKFKNQIN